MICFRELTAEKLTADGSRQAALAFWLPAASGEKRNGECSDSCR
jgi:hypothetical protein